MKHPALSEEGWSSACSGNRAQSVSTGVCVWGGRGRGCVCVPISPTVPFKYAKSYKLQRGWEKKKLKAKGEKKNPLYRNLNNVIYRKKTFEPTSKRSLHLTRGWESGLSFEAASKIPNHAQILSDIHKFSFPLHSW